MEANGSDLKCLGSQLLEEIYENMDFRSVKDQLETSKNSASSGQCQVWGRPFVIRALVEHQS